MIYSISGIAIAAFIFVGYFVYSEARIEKLQQANAILEQANETNQQAITDLNRNIAEIYELNVSLQKDLENSEGRKKELVRTLSNHDLTRLSIRKPGLIEKRINDATKALFKQLEDYTRSLSIPDDSELRQQTDSSNKSN